MFKRKKQSVASGTVSTGQAGWQVGAMTGPGAKVTATDGTASATKFWGMQPAEPRLTIIVGNDLKLQVRTGDRLYDMQLAPHMELHIDIQDLPLTWTFVSVVEDE